MTYRRIIHIDMDAFFASVEQRDQPELRGRPVAVGGDTSRGVLCTCSYEARKYGVRAAMPGYMARQLCPDIIFVPLRFEAYREVSSQIRDIFYSYTPLVEPLSLDEAFLDITEYRPQDMLAMEVAQEIKNRIASATHLTASAGVSYCKFMAKIASDLRKPDGLTVIHPSLAEPFILQLPIEKFFGVGKVTAAKMKDMDIHIGADLKKLSLHELTRWFGKSGLRFYHIVRGIDDSPVVPNRKTKSQAVERTLTENTNQLSQIETQLHSIIEALVARIQKKDLKGHTLTLKLKFADFQIMTRSKTFAQALQDSEDITTQTLILLHHHYPIGRPIRLLGLTISNFKQEAESHTQLSLDI